jgi:hypothetical protein
MLLVKKNVVEDESRLGTVKEASEAAAPGRAIPKLGEPTNRCSAALALKGGMTPSEPMSSRRPPRPIRRRPPGTVRRPE